MPRHTTKTAVIAGVALSAIGLVAASPASAHTNNLFTYIAEDVTTVGFATMDRTTAAVTSLGTPSAYEFDEVLGAEIFNEVGTAIATTDDEQEDEHVVLGWDHSTGAEETPVPLFVEGADLGYLTGLDTLADGTIITFAIYEVEIEGEPVDVAVIASVDRATGVLTPLIDVTDLTIDGSFWIESLATDPISGVTYALLSDDEESGESYYAPLDFDTLTYGTPTQFTGAGFGEGFFQGADFDVDGTLYFIYGNNEREEYELSTLGAPATWPTAERHYVADTASNYPDEYPLATLALTLEQAPAAPALANTGAEFPALALAAGGVAVLAGAVTVVTTRRRSRAVV